MQADADSSVSSTSLPETERRVGAKTEYFDLDMRENPLS
jgi:hypothetical protein